MKIVIINGPNLNLLGRRRPDIYGSETWEATLLALREAFPGIDFEAYQSNSEGELVSAIQRYGFDAGVHGIVINPGAYAHYSLAIADAIEAVPVDCVEVHISNIMGREEFRRASVTAAPCRAMIAGAGRKGYQLAVRLLADA